MKQTALVLRTGSGLCALLLTGSWLTSQGMAQIPAGVVVAWGINDVGQTNVPRNLEDVIAIAAGANDSLALTRDGTVVAWGEYIVHGWARVTVPSGLTNVTAVAAGYGHLLALNQNGTVVGWGWNGSFWGEAGQATVPSGLSNVVAIAAGVTHSLALKQDGTVVAWGDTLFGQSTVPRGLNDVIAISAGGYHNLALKVDGTVVAWGWDEHEQATVPNNLRDVVAVAAGSGHSLALKRDGTVVAWGYIFNRRDNYFEPITVPSDLSGVKAIAAGAFHCLALKQDGRIVAWGDGAHGETAVPSGLGRVLAIAGGGAHSLALLYPGPTVWASPTSQTAEAGSVARLEAEVGGPAPLVFQWFLNTTNGVSGGTNSSLRLPNVQPSQAGSYTLLVTNHHGAATSDVAELSVVAPVQKRALPVLHLTHDVGSVLHLFWADTILDPPSWQALDTVRMTNWAQNYPDRSLPNPTPLSRLYSVRQTDSPSGMRPTIGLTIATEITLTGAVGSKVSIDYINQFGPTNAWVNLDALTLTSTTQPYLDFTMFRRPARLYRVLPAP